jgi:hypothetical protein
VQLYPKEFTVLEGVSKHPYLRVVEIHLLWWNATLRARRALIRLDGMKPRAAGVSFLSWPNPSLDSPAMLIEGQRLDQQAFHAPYEMMPPGARDDGHCHVSSFRGFKV